MPKPHTFPLIFDQIKNIDISLLRKWSYLNHCYFKSGTITWSTNGIETSNISIATKMNTIKKVLILSYNCNGKSYKYEVPLVSLPSNLGNGIVWYFKCPFTNK